MSGTTPAPPAGWYANPEQPDTLRWWDGSTWGPVAPKPPTPRARTQTTQPQPTTAAYLQPASTPPAEHVQPWPSRRYPIKKIGVAWTFLLAGLLFLPMLGSHRMYLGKIGSGLGMLSFWIAIVISLFVYIETGDFAATILIRVLILAVLVWWVVDAVRLPKLVREANYRQ